MEHDPRVDEILRLAVSAAGPVTESPARWRNRVMRMIGEITEIFEEGSPQQTYAYQMLHSPRIAGTFMRATFNDNSKRYKVEYIADKSRKGEHHEEHIWSHRNHTPIGAHQEWIIKELQQGERIVLWKTIEQDESRGGDGQSFRTLVHIARKDAGTVSPPTGRGSPPPPPPSETPAAVPPAAEAPAEFTSGSAGAESKIPNPSVRTAYEALPGGKRVRLAQWGMEQGIHNLFDPELPDDKVQRILAQAELLQQGMV